MRSTKSLNGPDLLPLRVALLLLTCVRHVDAKLKFKDAESRTVDVEQHHLRLGGLEDEVAELLDLEAGLEGELELGACVRIAVRIVSKSNEEPPSAIIPGDESYQ